jgi:hypothetical protein
VRIPTTGESGRRLKRSGCERARVRMSGVTTLIAVGFAVLGYSLYAEHGESPAVDAG